MQTTAKSQKFFSFLIFYLSRIFYYYLSSIHFSHLSLSIFLLFIINLLFIFPQSGIVPGRQSTPLRRRCAPEGEAQPP
jgi:hypothetical protein